MSASEIDSRPDGKTFDRKGSDADQVSISLTHEGYHYVRRAVTCKTRTSYKCVYDCR